MEVLWIFFVVFSVIGNVIIFGPGIWKMPRKEKIDYFFNFLDGIRFALVLLLFIFFISFSMTFLLCLLYGYLEEASLVFGFALELGVAIIVHDLASMFLKKEENVRNTNC